MEKEKITVKDSKKDILVATVAPFIIANFFPNNPFGKYSPSLRRRWRQPPTPPTTDYLPSLTNIETVLINGKKIPICPVLPMPRID